MRRIVNCDSEFISSHTISGEDSSFIHQASANPMTLAHLAAQRKTAWTPKNLYWEVLYDGIDTPADNVPGPFMWDNPIDDVGPQHLSAEIESRGFAYNPVLSFGAYKIYPEPFVDPVKTTSANVLIDYIRWHGSAYSPGLPIQ